MQQLSDNSVLKLHQHKNIYYPFIEHCVNEFSELNSPNLADKDFFS